MRLPQVLNPLTGNGRYIFPSAGTQTPNGSRLISDIALLAALRRMGCGRALAGTILDEELGFKPDFIEHQLGHAVKNPNGRAYNGTSHLPERRKMMQFRANYLDDFKNEADMVPIRKVR